jgi:hypothetical protein
MFSFLVTVTVIIIHYYFVFVHMTVYGEIILNYIFQLIIAITVNGVYADCECEIEG